MSRNLSQEEFIEKANKIHNNFYDYSKAIYVSSHVKIIIICPIHGPFEQTPGNHLYGKGCRLCGKSKTKKSNTYSQEEYIELANKIHNNFYDYSKLLYTSAYSKVTIICPIHGAFEQNASSHLSGHKCKYCADDASRFSLGLFIDKATKIHSNFYKYTKTIYINSMSKVIITCPIHGDFTQKAMSHLSGFGCKKCANEKRFRTLESFIALANEVHNSFYNYSLFIYKNSQVKGIIICPKHGQFKQEPVDHLQGRGCPTCSNSQGEMKIDKWLSDNNINYTYQMSFDMCKNIKLLSFDFYLPDYNLCIEFDGDQHFKAVKYWGGEETLKKIKNNDNIKNKYCQDNNIQLLRIPYNELKNKNVENILETTILICKRMMSTT